MRQETVHAFLRERREQILRTWEELVVAEVWRVELTGLALRDSIPAFLDELADWLETGAPPGGQRLGGQSLRHVLDRLDLGFDLGQVLREYRLLREAILRVVLESEQQERDRAGRGGEEQRRKRVVELARLNAGLDVALSNSIEQFVAERDRRVAVERDRADSTVLESERKYRELFESLIEAYCVIEIIFDDQGKPVDFSLLETNPAFVKHATRPMLGKRIKEIVPDFEQSLLDHYGRVATTGEPARLEYIVAGLGDQWFRTSAFRVGGPGSRKVAVLFENMTERKGHEDALRESEEKYRSIVETADEGIVITRLDGAYTFVNQRMAEMLGCPMEEILGKSSLDFTFEEERPAIIAARESLNRLEAIHGEIKFRRPDGTPLWCRYNASPMLDEHGTHVANLALHTDVTAEVEAQEALRASEARLQKAVSAPTVGVLFFCLDGTLHSANAAFERMSGYSSAELREVKHWKTLTAPEFWEITETTASQLADQGEAPPYEKQMVRKDGSRWWGLFAPTRLSGFGARSECMEFIIDIDARKQAEQSLRSANEALREADKRKSEFLAILSHELRNPLGPIRNSIYLLERAAPGSEQATRARDVVRRQSEHLTRLIDDLLDVTRISHGKIPLQRSRLDLREIIRKTTDDLYSVFTQAGVKLRVDTAGPMWIDADATRMAQVLTNLLNNAMKFTSRGGTVRVSAAARDDRAELSVTDDGVGMDPQYIESMFEPFAQADQSLARTKGGLGLGLALVKSIVDLHGGTVTAHSEGLGRGSEFLVRLPLVTAGGESEKPRKIGTGTTPLTILVIEDNADGARSLADILELQAHHVRVARDGRSGIALAREVQPDVVVCDIGLPDLDGYEVARTLRHDAALRDTRLVALSGYAQPEDRQRARDAGFDAHIPKPLDLDELLRVIGKDS